MGCLSSGYIEFQKTIFYICISRSFKCLVGLPNSKISYFPPRQMSLGVKLWRADEQSYLKHAISRLMSAPRRPFKWLHVNRLGPLSRIIKSSFLWSESNNSFSAKNYPKIQIIASLFSANRIKRKLAESSHIQGWENEKRVVPRLRELAPRGQKESGGGNHATQGPLFCPALYKQRPT